MISIRDLIWLDDVVAKIEHKHGVTQDEVEEVLQNRPRFRHAERGRCVGEDLYYAYGQTDAGRHVLVVLILKVSREALIISARDMSARERKAYATK